MSTHPYVSEWREIRLQGMTTTLRKIRAADPCGMRLEDGQREFWLTLLACVLVFVLTAGCSEPTEIEAERATAAALQDAIAQAQAERPDLWTPETIERAKTAALIAAAGRK